MIFYEMHLRSFPKIKFACSVDVNNYKNNFGELTDVFEITFIERGSIVFEYSGGEKETVYPGTLICIPNDVICKSYSGVPRENQRHTTVGITADFDCVKRNTKDIADSSELKKKVKSGETVLIPYRFRPEEKSGNILSRLKRLSEAYESFYSPDYCSALSEWFSLAGFLSGVVLNAIDRSAVSPSNLNYMHKAKEYIKKHYREKISVSDIAAELCISEGYLYSIFRQTEKMSVVEFINRFRVETAMRYVENQKLSLKEAAFQVGIDDPAYMSRLFKKYNNSNFRKYKSTSSDTKISEK